MKKTFGLILITFGFTLIVFFFYYFWQQENKIVSPLPEEKGIKVIYISPTK
jgi:hypothetical protein